MSHTSESLRDAFKYLYPDELPALKTLAQSLPADPVVVNIGAGAGTSGLAFLESRPDLWLITIDRVGGDSPFGCLLAEENVLREAGYLYGVRYKHIIGDSSLVGLMWFGAEQFEKYGSSLWPLPYADLVFIDGDHSYDGCVHDILSWLPNIKQGGVLAVHDYKKESLYTADYNLDKPNDNYPHPKNWPGVSAAVDQFLLGKFEQVLLVDSLIAFKIGTIYCESCKRWMLEAVWGDISRDVCDECYESENYNSYSESLAL